VNPDRERTPARGYFRLTGYDQYDYSDYFVGDYSSLDLAIHGARERAATPNGLPTSFSDVYFVHDDEGVCKYHVTHDDLFPRPGNQESQS
jgi:hypothetical protein